MPVDRLQPARGGHTPPLRGQPDRTAEQAGTSRGAASAHPLQEGLPAQTRARIAESSLPPRQTAALPPVRAIPSDPAPAGIGSVDPTHTVNVHAHADQKVLDLLPEYADGKHAHLLNATYPGFSQFLTDKGLANTRAARNWLARVERVPHQGNAVHKAITDRHAIVLVVSKLKAITEQLSNPACSREEAARITGVDLNSLRKVLSDSMRLTELGRHHVETLGPQTQRLIEENLHWRERQAQRTVGASQGPATHTESPLRQIPSPSPSFFEGLPSAWNAGATPDPGPGEHASPDASFFEGLPGPWNLSEAHRVPDAPQVESPVTQTSPIAEAPAALQRVVRVTTITMDQAVFDLLPAFADGENIRLLGQENPPFLERFSDDGLKKGPSAEAWMRGLSPDRQDAVRQAVADRKALQNVLSHLPKIARGLSDSLCSLDEAARNTSIDAGSLRRIVTDTGHLTALGEQRVAGLSSRTAQTIRNNLNYVKDHLTFQARMMVRADQTSAAGGDASTSASYAPQPVSDASPGDAGTGARPLVTQEAIDRALATVPPESFTAFIEGLRLTEHIKSHEEALTYARIEVNDLDSLVTRPAGSALPELTPLGEAYVAQSFGADAARDFDDVIASRSGKRARTS